MVTKHCLKHCQSVKCSATILFCMPKSKILQLRVSENEYERIRNNAMAKKQSTVSSYCRSVILRDDLFIESRVVEINSNVKEILRILSQK